MARHDARQFGVDVRQFYQGKVPRELNAKKIEIALELTAEFVGLSPVVTGFFRGNWSASLDDPRTDVLEGRQSAAQRLSAIERVVQSARPGQTVWVINNADYAPFLEDRYHIVATGTEAVLARHAA